MPNSIHIIIAITENAGNAFMHSDKKINENKTAERFRIETSISTYTPDRAVYLDKNDEEKLYFVLETKDSIDMFELRTKEQLKIYCGKKILKYWRALNFR